MRVGLFGGSFDPPHVGHVAIAERSLEAADLDRLIWMPAARAPHKLRARQANAADRLELCRRATQGNERFEVSDLEIRRRGVSYTVDTLRALHADRPGDELFLVIGGDSLDRFGTWKDPGGILELARLVVYPRPGIDLDPRLLPAGTILLDAPLLDLSSTAIRSRIRAGRPLTGLVPDSVLVYMEDHGLYR